MLICVFTLGEQFLVEKRFFLETTKENVICAAAFAVSLLAALVSPNVLLSAVVAAAVSAVTGIFFPDYLMLIPAAAAACVFKAVSCRDEKYHGVLLSFLSVSLIAQIARIVYRFRLGGRIDPFAFSYSRWLALITLLVPACFFVYKALFYAEPAEKKKRPGKQTVRKKYPCRLLYVFCALSVVLSFVYCLYYCGGFFMNGLIAAWAVVLLVIGSFGSCFCCLRAPGV